MTPHPYAPQPYAPIPDALLRGLVWAPEMLVPEDPITRKRGTPDGTTYNITGDYRSFDGTTDRIDFPNVADYGTTPAAHSGACWIYPTSVAAGLRNIWTASSTTPAQSVIFRRNAAALEFAHAYSVTTLQHISGNVLTVNTWYHVGWSYDGSGTAAGALLYISGAEVSSYATTTNPSGTARAASGLWSLGGRVEADTNNFAGRIRQPMVWNRVLSAAEFASLAGLPRPA